MKFTFVPTVALSLRQPWAHAVVHGGKRVENRVAWTNSRFRGPFLIHASAGMTRQEWCDARDFAYQRHLAWTPPDPKRLDGETHKPMVLERGGIVGVARVVDVIRPLALPRGRPIAEAVSHLPEEQRKWWMGAFALVLEDVCTVPFVASKGALGFFKVTDDVRKLVDLSSARAS